MHANMTERRPSGLQLALFWLGIQAVWGALLGISLQARSGALAGQNALAAYGTIAATGAVVAAIVQIAAGSLSDRQRVRGGKRLGFYAAGAVVASCGIAWFYLAPTFAQLIAAFAVVQVGMNVAMGAYQAVIPDFVADQQAGAASSWMAALQSLGNAVGAIVAAVVAEARLVAAALIALLLATCAASTLHLLNVPLRREPDEVPPRVRARTFIDLFVSRALVYVGFYTLLGYLYYYVRSVYVRGAPEIRDLRLVVHETGILILIFTVTGAIGAAIAARPSDRADKRLVASIGGGVFALALLAFIVLPPSIAMYAAIVAAGAAWGVFLVADWALACRIVPRNALARSMAIWNLAVVGPQIAAPLFTTVVLARIGAIASPDAARIAFALAVVETVCGIAWLWRLPEAFARNLPSG
jgi:MFS family permease